MPELWSVFGQLPRGSEEISGSRRGLWMARKAVQTRVLGAKPTEAGQGALECCGQLPRGSEKLSAGRRGAPDGSEGTLRVSGEIGR
eukprot:6882531-Alexandrium_andersonii.AAC.1